MAIAIELVVKSKLPPHSGFHSGHPPFCRGSVGGEGGLGLQPNFQKGGLDRTSTFRGGLLGKRGDFSGRGVCNFHIKMN